MPKQTTRINGQLQIDHNRGVIYFHGENGITTLRIGNLPAPIPQVDERQLDIGSHDRDGLGAGHGDRAEEQNWTGTCAGKATDGSPKEGNQTGVTMPQSKLRNGKTTIQLYKQEERSMTETAQIVEYVERNAPKDSKLRQKATAAGAALAEFQKALENGGDGTLPLLDKAAKQEPDQDNSVCSIGHGSGSAGPQ